MSSEAGGPNPSLRYGNFMVLCEADGKPRLLGKGTFGSTYFAQHRFLETNAALKVINERFAAEPSARERFLREGRALARLDHRYIARLQDFGEAGGTLFYAMEYCEGGNLAERVSAHGAFPLAEWLLVAQQVASALACCHTAGFIHRDLKPSNIMLARRQGPLAIKLIDFGLVHAERRTDAGESMGGSHFIGTPLYASPEQLREEGVDARSDLFAFGMTLWHLASGAPPETGPSPRVITRRLSYESYEPQLPAHLPDPLRAILARLVEKEPDDRPDSAAEVLAALNEAARELSLPTLHEVAGSTEESGEFPEGAPPIALPNPCAVVVIGGDLESEFRVLSVEGEQPTGINYAAEPVTGGGARVWLHSVHPALVCDAALFAKFRTAVAALQAFAIPGVLTPASVRTYANHTAVVLGAPGGPSLLSALKQRGAFPLAEARGLLERIAQGCDRLVAAGLPGIELNAAGVFLRAATGGHEEPEFVPRYLSARETAALVASTVEENHVDTMTPESFDEAGAGDRPAQQFARLIFRVTAGRDCPGAASLSVQGYVAVPGLSEDGNRLLAQVIARAMDYSTCAALLTDLLIAEGLVGGGGGRSGRAAGTKSRARVERERAHSEGPGGSARLPLGRSGPAAPVAPAIPPPPSPKPPPEEPPPRTPHAAITKAAPVEPRRASRRWPVLPVVGGVCVAGILAWWFWPKKPDRPPRPGGGILPPGAVVRFVDNALLAQGEFTVGGAKVAVRQNKDGNWEVPVGSQPLGVVVAFRAKGYELSTKAITTPEDLRTDVLIYPKRITGTLIFKGTGSVDYTNFSLNMAATLPEDNGLVQLERAPIGGELSTGKEVRKTVATGKWKINLHKPPNRPVASLELPPVEIREKAEEVIVLPPSFVGRYAGELRDPSGAGVELVIDAGLTSGEFSDLRGGAPRQARFEDGKIDGAGVFTALVPFSTVPDPVGYDERIKVRHLPKSGEVEVTLTENPEPNPKIQKLLQRPPRPPGEWSRSGTLRRTGER